MNHDHLHLDGITEIAGLRVGHWSDADAATGCTVVLCPPEGAVGGVDVRGGAPGTRETDLLTPGRFAERVHAVLLTGGSAFGLDAAGGVMRYLEEQGVGVEFGGSRVPLVPAAVIFDLGIGDGSTRPGAEEGYRAAQAATDGMIDQGSAGAGTGATVAKAGGVERRLKGGLGTACEHPSTSSGQGLLVGALAVVNAGGDVFDPHTGMRIAGPRADEPGVMLDGWELMRKGEASRVAAGENTTLAVVATNAKLTKEQANRLASVAHDGLARTIRPVHTISDGDTVFALATGEVEVEGAQALMTLEALAVRAVERAIVRGVICATGLEGVPSVQEWTAQALR
jgi:L-aminopeptidase/D-esterase-like protein